MEQDFAAPHPLHAVPLTYDMVGNYNKRYSLIPKRHAALPPNRTLRQDFAALQPPLSPFPITDAQFTAAHQFVLTWTSVANYNYQVQTRTNLLLGNWEPRTNITATGPVTSWTNSTASDPTAFFRIFAPTP